MSTKSTNTMRKPNRLAYSIIAALALLVIMSPGLAAGARQSALVEGSPTWAKGASGMMGTVSSDTDNRDQPDTTCPSGGQCFADVPPDNPFYTFINRIYMQDLVTGYQCGGPGELCDPYNRPYYRPVNNVTRQQMAKFIDNARRLPEIHLDVNSGTSPIFSRNNTGTAIGAYSTSGQAFVAISQSQYAIYAQTGNTAAVAGLSTGGTSGVGVQGTGGTGVKGNSTSGTGVQGNSGSGRGVYGYSDSDVGVYGQSPCPSCRGVDGESSSGTGVFGYSATGQAGHFTGNVQVTGNLSKGGGSFKIDDPLDPANKYLYHSFVESPDMMNVYNGNVTLDRQGEATVQLPDWFGALNKDYRYQLTALGAPGPNLYVSKKVENNRFSIAGGTPGMEVSWQVTGIRQDPYANAHRIPVEEDKPDNERGKYLHPTEWGQPESSGIDYDVQQSAQQVTESKP